MKICRFNDDRIGLLVGKEVRDITDLVSSIGISPPSRPRGDPLVMALPRIADMLDGGAPESAKVALSEISLLSPVLLPTKIMGAGNNYRAHKAEMEADPTAAFSNLPQGLQEIGLFLKASTSLVGPSEGIALRFPERRTDYELELVAIIGRRASCVSREMAKASVAAYCLGLDISLRGPQMRSLRKSIDSYCVAGPWLVTTDEIPDLHNLRLKLTVNGSVRQEMSTADMIDDVATIVQYASEHYTLYPGDMIYTGTGAGVGPIHPGDVLRVEGDHLGSFTTKVRAFAPDDRC